MAVFETAAVPLSQLTTSAVRGARTHKAVKLTCLANRLLTVRMHGIKIGIIADLAMIPFS